MQAIESRWDQVAELGSFGGKCRLRRKRARRPLAGVGVLEERASKGARPGTLGLRRGAEEWGDRVAKPWDSQGQAQADTGAGLRATSSLAPQPQQPWPHPVRAGRKRVPTNE